MKDVIFTICVIWIPVIIIFINGERLNRKNKKIIDSIIKGSGSEE